VKALLLLSDEVPFGEVGFLNNGLTIHIYNKSCLDLMLSETVFYWQ